MSPKAAPGIVPREESIARSEETMVNIGEQAGKNEHPRSALQVAQPPGGKLLRL